MNVAWDSFRIIDNNANNVIFMRPDDPCSEEFTKYASSNKYKDVSVNLETIRKKLTYRYYINLEEYIDEMQILFQN